MRKLVTATAIGLCLTASTVLVTAPEASAATRFGCSFPRVCLYKTKTDLDRQHPTAAFKDLTSATQSLSRSIGAFAVYNARNDDGARIVSFVVDKPGFDDSLGLDTRCVRPNSLLTFPKNVVTREIQIVDSPNC